MISYADWINATIVTEETGAPMPVPSAMKESMPRIQRYLDSAQRAFALELRDQENVRQVWQHTLYAMSLSPRSRWDTARWNLYDDECCPYCGR